MMTRRKRWMATGESGRMCGMQNWLDIAKDAKGVVFDFGGVISLPPGDGWAAYRVAAELGLDRAAFDAGFRKYRQLWDGGFIDGLEMYRRIFADNALPATDDDLRLLLAADCEGWVRSFNADTLALMRTFKSQGRKVGILTNMSVEFRDGWFIPKAGESIALADAMVISGEHRVCKPDPAIYRLMEERLGLAGPELVFFDDSPANVEGALRCGWRAYQFKSDAPPCLT